MSAYQGQSLDRRAEKEYLVGMILTIITEAGFLRVVVTGEFCLEEAQRTFLDIIDAVAKYKTDKILFDGREIVGEPHSIERFYYGAFTAEMCHKHLYKAEYRIVPMFAYVLKEPVLDPRRFGETVARNRGMIVKAFDNLNEAQEWLGLTS